MSASDQTSVSSGPGFAGAVLAGGASRRMGRDKALVVIDGHTLVSGAVAALDEAGAGEVVVVGGDHRAMRDLGVRLVPDRYPGAGPLGGLVTALGVVEAPVVVVLSCDLLEPSPEVIRAVVAALGDADVAVPVADGRDQWLHAAWRRTALPDIEASFHRGRRAPRALEEILEVVRLEPGGTRWARDADEPSDLPPGAL